MLYFCLNFKSVFIAISNCCSSLSYLLRYLYVRSIELGQEFKFLSELLKAFSILPRLIKSMKHDFFTAYKMITIMLKCTNFNLTIVFFFDNRILHCRFIEELKYF